MLNNKKIKIFGIFLAGLAITVLITRLVFPPNFKRVNKISTLFTLRVNHFAKNFTRYLSDPQKLFTLFKPYATAEDLASLVKPGPTPPPSVVFKPMATGISTGFDPITQTSYLQISHDAKIQINPYTLPNGEKVYVIAPLEH